MQKCIWLFCFNRSMRIAVTGGIAEGKSTVMGYLREMGFETASADAMAREVFQDEEVQGRLQALVGGDASRDQLRERIAADDGFRRQVNGVMHPLIVKKLIASPADFIEVPLLFEAALHPLFDRVWVVTCGAELQLTRLTERLGNVQDAKALIDTQLPTLAKCAFADEVIRTNGSEESVKALVMSAKSREFAK